MARQVHCKFCGGRGPAAQAHIIPKAFFSEILNKRDRKLVSVPLYDLDQTRTFQTPPFDWGILCQNCESRLSPLDRVGVSVFRDGRFRRIVPFPNQRFYGMGDVDGAMLRRFLLFVLWRIGASDHHACRHVRLDEHLSRLREVIEEPSLLQDREYPIVINQLCGPVILNDDGAPVHIYSREIPLNPTEPHEAFGITAVDFELSGYIISVGLEPRPDRSPWDIMALGTQVPLVAWQRFSESRKWDFLRTEISKSR